MNTNFFYHLRDTIILLGGEARIANMLEYPDSISEFDVDELRRINGRLLDATKEKLVSINKIKVVVGHE